MPAGIEVCHLTITKCMKVTGFTDVADGQIEALSSAIRVSWHAMSIAKNEGSADNLALRSPVVLQHQLGVPRLGLHPIRLGVVHRFERIPIGLHCGQMLSHVFGCAVFWELAIRFAPLIKSPTNPDLLG
jgi:hypothetical protein